MTSQPINLALGRVASKQKKYGEAIALLERSFQANNKVNTPLVEEGSVYVQQSRWSDAQAVLQKAMILSDDNKAKVNYLIGVSYSRQKKYPQAEKTLQDSVKQDKSNRDAQVELARVYLAQGKDDDAYDQYSKLMNGNDAIAAESLDSSGKILLKQKKYSKSYDLFSKATKIRPDDPSLWNSLGESAVGMGNTQEGLDDFNRAIAFNTNDYRAYNNKAKAHESLKDWTNAKQAYEKALAIQPNSIPDWEGLANTSEHANDYQSQVQALEKLETLEPHKAAYSLKLGDTYRSKDNLPLAKKAYLRVLNNDPKSVKALESIAEIEQKNGQISQSEIYYKKVLEVEPSNEEALRELGKISFQNQQYAKAEFYFGSLLKYNKKDADAANRLAISKEKNKENSKDVIVAYELAYSLDPKANVQAGIRAAQLRKDSGDNRGAIGKYDRVLNQNPGNTEALSEKADLQVSTKDWAAAVKSYEELHARKAPTAESSVALAEAYKNTGQNDKG